LSSHWPGLDTPFAGIAGRWRRPRWHLARDDCENVRRPGVSGLRALTASTNRDTGDTGDTIECLLVMVVVDSLQAVDRIAPACSPVDPAVEDRPRTASARACAWPRMHAPAPGRADARFRPIASAPIGAGAARYRLGTQRSIRLCFCPASQPIARLPYRVISAAPRGAWDDRFRRKPIARTTRSRRSHWRRSTSPQPGGASRSPAG
jgi:hypothetical protein